MLRQINIRANILVFTVAFQSPWWLIYTGSFTSKVTKQVHNDRTSLHGKKIMKQNVVQ